MNAVISLDNIRRKRLERHAKDACSGINEVIATHIVEQSLATFDRTGDEELSRRYATERAYAQRTRFRVHAWRGGGDDNRPSAA